MKLSQLLETEPAPEKQPAYKIYVDLDGVLADFALACEELCGFSPDDKTISNNEKWKKINKASDDKGFWSRMKMMPDAKKLWEYLKEHHPIILTATGSSKFAPGEKREWVEKHLGHQVKVILVRDGKDKAQYASPHSILIDDSHKKVIEPWDKAGGIGIHHQTVERTIRILKDLGI